MHLYYDFTNIGSPVIVFVDTGGFGGIAYLSLPPQLIGIVASE